MRNEPEKGFAAFNPHSLDACGVLNCDGIYYARLKVAGQEAPLMIALHGIQSELEAMRAFSTLVKLPFAQCCI